MSINKNKFHKKYNHLQMDKYLIESKKIKDKSQRTKFWNDLMINYKKDLNELNNIDLSFGAQISLDSKFRYKKGGLLSADFETFCKSQIELLKNESSTNLLTENLTQAPTKTYFISGNSEMKKRLQNSTAGLRYFQIYFETKDGKEKNNKSKLNTENWKTHKDTFFKQRMETYPESWTIKEKIEQELEGLEILTINETDHKKLKSRYREYLINQTVKAEQETSQNLPNDKIPEFNPNYFNKDGSLLFEYLIENYIEPKKSYGVNKRFTNVWHFMKNDNLKCDVYNFRFTKKEYLKFIKNRFEINITNTDKTINKYEKTDLPQLRDHVLNFEDSKKIE